MDLAAGNHVGNRLVRGLAGVLLVLALGGCSLGNFGGSSAFGGAPTRIADISGQGISTVDDALARARAHFKTNDFGYSAAYYKRAAELAPQNAESYVGLAASYDRLGRFDLSDRVYASLHRISGDSVQYFNNLGYSFMLRGNLRSALVNFRKAAALDPENLVVANNIRMLSDAVARSSA